MKYSGGDIKRLGDSIVDNKGYLEDSELEILQEYRKSFIEPLATTFNKLVKIKNNVSKDGIIAFRLKRIITIINKVLRNPQMNLNRMGDIAGIRIILNSDDQVYHALESIEQEFELSGKIRDYIKDPKPIGYKGVHVYVKDPKYGKRIEIQLRTREYHNWSTLVEITDLLYSTRLKELGYENNPEFGEFHRLISSKDELSENQANQLYNILEKHNFIDKLSKTFRRNNAEVQKQWYAVSTRSRYFLIESSTDDVPKLTGFVNYDQAEEAYFNSYKKNSETLIVLTAIQKPTFEQISVAYANYILSYHTFIKDIEPIIKTLAIEALEQGKVRKFKKIFETYEELEANSLIHIFIGKGGLSVLRKKNKLIFSSSNKISSRKRKIIRKEINNELTTRMKNHGQFIKEIKSLINGMHPKSIFCRIFLKRNGKRLKRRLRNIQVEFEEYSD
ncbi:hypothetical protein [uncultured Maribacter sp.]|uniref:hypothetical protein n=1 Tax=uncultured Maribacter sp. TaxID=431308 RepID=UPI0030DDCD56|tara:strand:- start:2047 stop:3384 length:1338 start_codon:yes stop_codon:yes gene_type:complete